MRGKLYLRSCYKGVMKSVYNVNIARGDMEEVVDRLKNLAPSLELFKWYMKNRNSDNWFDDYRKVYLNQLKNNKDALRDLEYIKAMLDEGNDVCLYCFCKDVNLCHRGIIGNLFIKKGYEVDFK